MQAKAEERKRARALRAQGMSVKRIAKELAVSQSSVSVWVRDVSKPPATPEPSPREPSPLDPRSKRCGRCGHDRSLSHFNRARGGHQHWCRDCFREYFFERGPVHREQSRGARRRRIEVAIEHVRSHLQAHPCVDCGEEEIAVLEFDHVAGKTADVARLMGTGASVRRLQDEIRRCEVVCACCHRRRTASRANWARAASGDASGTNGVRERNLRHVLSVLAFAGCVDCGESDPVVLDFDHVGPKSGSIAKLMPMAALDRLKREIAECEVRCCNCHRLITFARQGGTWRGAPDWFPSG